MTTASKPILTALLLAGLAQVDTAHAVLATGDRLTINGGTVDASGYVNGGSYFGMDMVTDSVIAIYEKAPINYSSGTGAGCAPGPVSVAGSIPIGSTIAATGAHSGCIKGTESPAFDVWEFFSNTGMDYIQTTPVTDNGNGTLDWRGWTVAWNTFSSIPTASGAWQPLNCDDLGCTGWTFTDGTARFQWSGVYGDAYTLDYTATTSAGIPGVPYYLHLEGTVQPIPIPAAVWLFGSGLISLIALGRRKNSRGETTLNT